MKVHISSSINALNKRVRAIRCRLSFLFTRHFCRLPKTLFHNPLRSSSVIFYYLSPLYAIPWLRNILSSSTPFEFDRMGDHGKIKSDISLPGIFASSAFAACFAEVCTLPLDTAKVRLQLQKKAVEGDGLGLPKYRGLLGTVGTIAREEGMSALWKGVVPGLHRQCLFGGLRIGLYEPVKNFYVGKDHVGDVPLSKKILAALTTGALGITVANPTDLVKVRLQAEGKLPPGVPRRYTGAVDAYSKIVRQEGVAALWTGLGPNVARNAIINAAELASYDQVKQTILKIPGFTDNVLTHLFAGLGAGFVAVCIGSPVDVVKSRMMGDSTYKSTLDCFVKTLKNDGPLAFYKGFIANFGRLGSWNVIMFLTLEQAKKFVKSIESS